MNAALDFGNLDTGNIFMELTAMVTDNEVANYSTQGSGVKQSHNVTQGEKALIGALKDQASQIQTQSSKMGPFEKLAIAVVAVVVVVVVVAAVCALAPELIPLLGAAVEVEADLLPEELAGAEGMIEMSEMVSVTADTLDEAGTVLETGTDLAEGAGDATEGAKDTVSTGKKVWNAAKRGAKGGLAAGGVATTVTFTTEGIVNGFQTSAMNANNEQVSTAVQGIQADENMLNTVEQGLQSMMVQGSQDTIQSDGELFSTIEKTYAQTADMKSN